MIGEQFDPDRLVHLPAEAAEQREALRILNLALRAVDADAAAIAIEEDAALFIGGARGGVEVAPLPADQPGSLPAKPAARKAVICGQLSEDAAADSILLGRSDRHLVDHAAGRADALKRVGTVDQLDPVDEEGVDGIAVARSVADRGRLGDAVDREQRGTAAQGFA